MGFSLGSIKWFHTHLMV